MWKISVALELIWWESRIFRTCLRTNFQAIWPRYHFPSNIIYFTIGHAIRYEKKYRPTIDWWLIWKSTKHFLWILKNIITIPYCTKILSLVSKIELIMWNEGNGYIFCTCTTSVRKWSIKFMVVVFRSAHCKLFFYTDMLKRK